MPETKDSAHSYSVRDFAPDDSSAIFRINDAEIPNVTLFAPGELLRLAEQAVYFRVAESRSGEIAGFVLALSETALYASLNFQWFKSRYPKFVYIDRIVVSATTRGSGVGKLLYADLINVASKLSPLLACEVNLRPSNPRSLGFHRELGFHEVGTQETEGGKKTVSLMIRELGRLG